MPNMFNITGNYLSFLIIIKLIFKIVSCLSVEPNCLLAWVPVLVKYDIILSAVGQMHLKKMCTK